MYVIKFKIEIRCCDLYLKNSNNFIVDVVVVVASSVYILQAKFSVCKLKSTNKTGVMELKCAFESFI